MIANMWAVTKPHHQNTNKHSHMTTLAIKGDWNILKGTLKQKWAKLTDDDLQYTEGKAEELIGRIQKRTGETREAVEEANRPRCGGRRKVFLLCALRQAMGGKRPG